MAGQELILCIDIGAESIKASEFLCSAENIELSRFAYLEYINNDEEASALDATVAALKSIISTNKFAAKSVYLSLSGQNALIPFIKVPAMTTEPEKIRELVTFEAKSRIPYALDEVVWDYQLIDNPDGADEIDAMLVSVKNEEVIRITDAVESLGKKVKSVEVSPTALYNAVRANGIGDTQCEMILNIGGKSSTLVFVDGPRFFVRSIPIAGNYITQQIAKEFNIPFAEADEIKRRHGFVALGGAYDEPESDVAATVSKIVRNVMTRLHGEINRSINVYRAQQHGRKPEKLYLTGGSSIMAFTPRFFVEKLRIPVEYFNPFPIIPIAPDVDRDALQELAHLYGETIGLALRHFRSTPVEISLVPEQVKQQKVMKRKHPFFYLSAIFLLGYLGVSYWSLDRQAKEIDEQRNQISWKLQEKQSHEAGINSAKNELKKSNDKYAELEKMLADRNEFIPVLNEIQEQVKNYSEGHKWMVWITELRFSDKKIKLDGASDDQAKESRTAKRAKKKKSKANAGKVQKENDLYVYLNGYAIRNQRDSEDVMTIASRFALRNLKPRLAENDEDVETSFDSAPLIQGKMDQVWRDAAGSKDKANNVSGFRFSAKVSPEKVRAAQIADEQKDSKK